jgi:hypothetical protein
VLQVLQALQAIVGQPMTMSIRRQPEAAIAHPRVEPNVRPATSRRSSGNRRARGANSNATLGQSAI